MVNRLLPLALYLTIAVASGFSDLRMRAYPTYATDQYIPKVLDGSYGAPAIYRVLVPYSVKAASEATGISLGGTWLAMRLAWFFAAYLVLDRYLRTWFTPAAAVGGTLLVAATLPLTFTNSWAHPDHAAELALFTLGCLAVARKRDILFAVVLALAALNRETAGFLVLLYAAAAIGDPRRVRMSLLFAVEFAVVFAGLRLWRGFEHYEYWQFAKNLVFLKLLPEAYDPYYRSYAYFGLVIFAPLALAAMCGLRRAPAFARRALWVALPFVATGLTISSIIESRIFTPLYPLLLPAAVAAWWEPTGNSAPLAKPISGGVL